MQENDEDNKIIDVMAQPKFCSECKHGKIVPILYGLPGPEITKKMIKPDYIPEFTLGGCEVSDNDPQWECLECGTKYRTKDQ